MTTSTMDQQRERPKAFWQPDFATVVGVAAALGAVAALCEDATLRLVLWALLQ